MFGSRHRRLLALSIVGAGALACQPRSTPSDAPVEAAPGPTEPAPDPASGPTPSASVDDQPGGEGAPSDAELCAHYYELVRVEHPDLTSTRADVVSQCEASLESARARVVAAYADWEDQWQDSPCKVSRSMEGRCVHVDDLARCAMAANSTAAWRDDCGRDLSPSVRLEFGSPPPAGSSEAQ